MCVYVFVWIGKAPHTIVVGIVLTHKHMRIPFYTRIRLDSKNIINFNHIWDLAHLLYSILELCMLNYKEDRANCYIFIPFVIDKIFCIDTINSSNLSIGLITDWSASRAKKVLCQQKMQILWWCRVNICHST